ncbi:glycosyltransferase [Actinokineospora sp. 24-640]
MRILVTACPAASHFQPLVPLARAAQAAGHEVVVAIGGGFAARAAATGLDVRPVGGDVDLMSVPGGPGRSGWARMVALTERTVVEVLDLARRWRPDFVLRTPPEFAGALAAREVGAALVELSFGMVMPRDRLIAAERELAGLREPGGWLADPDVLLDLCPPSLRPSHLPEGTLLRYEPYDGESVDTDEIDVCLTLGTILPGLGRTEVVQPVLRAAADLGLRVMTLGLEPSDRWTPLSAVLRRCRVLAHHGGAGTTFSALAAGVPQLLMPHMTEQPDVGVTLPPAEVTRDSARRALAHLLAPEARAAAHRVRDEIAAMPSPADVVGRLFG